MDARIAGSPYGWLHGSVDGDSEDRWIGGWADARWVDSVVMSGVKTEGARGSKRARARMNDGGIRIL